MLDVRIVSGAESSVPIDHIVCKTVPMCSLESFKIDLKGLDEGVRVLEYHLVDDYFEAIDAPEVRSGDLHVNVSVRKTADLYELEFRTEGTVAVPCDLCLDDMEQRIEAKDRLLVRLGNEYSEEDDVVIVDENEGILDTSWIIYEFIALAIPIKHVHAPGKCNPAMIEALEGLTTDRSSDEESTKPVDPRWSELEKLKTIIKD